jgi:lipoprotein-anchoring transpeptidase ErfK/SrfK
MKKTIIPILVVLALILAGIYFYVNFSPATSPTPAPTLPPIVATPLPPLELPSEIPAGPMGEFKSVILSSENPGGELAKLVGGVGNAFIVLAINRIDDRNLHQGMSMIVPTTFEDPTLWQFMPEEISNAKNIPKLVIVNQRTQAFGFFENGKLVRSGPVSSGKESTPTPNGLFFTNWKGKEVVSTFSDEWVLKWDFNIDNFNGVALHQYAMPGYPASHSCVRLYEKDAKWLYDWADQWVLADDGQTKLASGIPVIIYGKYDFSKGEPWKMLPENPEFLKISEDELEELVNKNLAKIEHEQALREQVLGGN